MRFMATREIQIDAGHRVPDHKSKCKNLHGHRYVIQASFSAEALQEEGSERGMVKDFSFMKEIMMEEIDKLCDHGLILYYHDLLLPRLLTYDENSVDRTKAGILPNVQMHGGYGLTGIMGQKLYITDFVPTAENLAKHWYERLVNRLADLMVAEKFTVVSVRVFETPNCFADYPV